MLRHQRVKLECPLPNISRARLRLLLESRPLFLLSSFQLSPPLLKQTPRSPLPLNPLKHQYLLQSQPALKVTTSDPAPTTAGQPLLSPQLPTQQLDSPLFLPQANSPRSLLPPLVSRNLNMNHLLTSLPRTVSQLMFASDGVSNGEEI